MGLLIYKTQQLKWTYLLVDAHIKYGVSVCTTKFRLQTTLNAQFKAIFSTLLSKGADIYGGPERSNTLNLQQQLQK